MIPKQGFACLLVLFTLTFASSAHAAVANDGDTGIGALEVRLFSHSFNGECPDARLARLEKFVFGASAADSSISARLTNLEKV